MSSSFRVARISPGLADLTAVMLFCSAIHLFVSLPVSAQDAKLNVNAPGFDVATKNFNDQNAPVDGNPGVTAADFYKLLDNSIADRFSSLILVFGGCYSGDFSTAASNSKIAKKPVAILTATAPTNVVAKGRYECTPSLDGDNPFLTGVTNALYGTDEMSGNARMGTASDALEAGKGKMTNAVNAYNTEYQAAINEGRRDENGNTIKKAEASNPGLTTFPKSDDPNSASPGATLALSGPAGANGKKYAIIFMGNPQTYYDWTELQTQYQSLIDAGYHVAAFFGTGTRAKDDGAPLLTNPNSDTGAPGISVRQEAHQRAEARNGQEPQVEYNFTDKNGTVSAVPFQAATFGNLKAALAAWKVYATEDKEGKNQYFVLIGTHSTLKAKDRGDKDLEISQLLQPSSGGGPFYVGGAPTPPTDRSLSDLGGKPQLFVAGEVSSQDQMLVTLRGTNTIEGVVVSAEANGRKTEARTNSKGQVILNMAAIAGNAASLAMGTIRALDAGGHELAQEPTKITPTTSNAGPNTARASTVATRPEVPTLGLLQNGGVATIPGKNLGSESVLVVGNRTQETLSASSKEMTSFIDAPAVGPQPAYVRNSHGSSATQTVHCYNFTVAASQTTIVRGQHVTVTAHYDGLPPGSQIEFTNKTPTVVKMNVQAGRSHGEQGICTASKGAGTCEVELTGRSQGAFVINYKIEPPR